MHVIKLDGYNATVDNGEKLELGTFGSYGEEQLQIVKAPDWGNLSVIATFNSPNKKSVQVVVDSVTGVIKVPKEATADLYGVGTIVFVGLADGVQRISADVEYIVRKHSNASGTEPAEPTPDVVQQILSAANGAVKTADGVREDMDKVLEAESGRETAEADRAEAESARVEAETVRVDAEAYRAAAEKERQTAESARLAAENDRQSAETTRAKAETARESAETDRATAEVARVNAEEERADYEKLRKDHETQRVTDETVRQTAESKRKEAETARADAEQSRVKAETDRMTSETARKDAESKRANAEQERQTAEEGRVEAESSRVKAEAEREKQLPALKSSVDELRARQNILVGSETGNPVAVDDAFAAPLCGLTLYGKSTQDGTPTPDAPVPIVSAGDGGTVTAKVTGANLLDLNVIFDLVLGASQSTVKDGHITGTTKSQYAQIGFILKDELSAQYTVSLSGGSASVSTELRVYIWNNNSLGNNVTSKTVPAGEKASCTFETDGKHEYAVWFRPNGVSDYDYYDIQLELGSTVTAYEPYHEQLLTLQTPNGLPGIPVASGGNYTDQSGQQWVCDEVDLERGVMVQRIASFVIDAKNANDIFVTNGFTNVTVATNMRLQTPQKTNRDDRKNGRCAFCEALPWSKDAWASHVNAAGFIENNSVDLTIENSYLGLSEASTNDERKTALVKYFTAKPCRVVYRIATPIETPLTPAEIAAYKALTAYAPDTVVQASDGAGIKLDYQRDVNLVVKNLEDAIASMTTT